VRTLLLDADIIAYQFAVKAQKTTDWGDGDVMTQVEEGAAVTPALDDKLLELQAQLEADAFVICLSCPTDEGWRRKILPSYKSNRGPKPALLGPLKDYLSKTHRTYLRPTLEADDVMGILSTHPTLIPGEKVIVSIDKDMKTIPGWLFNPDKDKFPRLIEQQEADYWHLYQTLVGDTTDFYKGCPGVGPKKAEAILFGVSPPWGNPEEMWPAVLAAFKAKGLTEEDALVQARVARICRHTDYDFKRKEVILWKPQQ
jgi:DNA polymerase-1